MEMMEMMENMILSKSEALAAYRDIDALEEMGLLTSAQARTAQADVMSRQVPESV